MKLYASNENILGQRKMPPLAASAPSFNERASKFRKGYIMSTEKSNIKPTLAQSKILLPSDFF
ncbi:hypothetical protein D3C76_1643250 [compost metagenome]